MGMYRGYIGTMEKKMRKYYTIGFSVWPAYAVCGRNGHLLRGSHVFC